MKTQFPWFHWLHVLIASYLLLGLLTACGSTPPHSTRTAIPKAVSSNNAIPSVSPNVTNQNPLTDFIPNKPFAFDAQNLHIQTDLGLQCPLGTNRVPGGIGDPSNNLVLANDRFTYDAADIQQMVDYVAKNNIMLNDHFDEWKNVPPPTLQWISGGYSVQLGGYDDMNTSTADCGLALQITNTGASTVQVSQVSTQFALAPVLNTRKYNIIDICTLYHVMSGACTIRGAGPSYCDFYQAFVNLQATQTMYTAAISAGKGCSQLTLQPGQTHQMFIIFQSAVARNMIYTIDTNLIVTNGSGQNTISLPTARVVLADDSQFTCYGLQGTNFVAEPRVVDVTSARYCV